MPWFESLHKSQVVLSRHGGCIQSQGDPREELVGFDPGNSCDCARSDSCQYETTMRPTIPPTVQLFAFTMPISAGRNSPRSWNCSKSTISSGMVRLVPYQRTMRLKFPQTVPHKLFPRHTRWARRKYPHSWHCSKIPVLSEMVRLVPYQITVRLVFSWTVRHMLFPRHSRRARRK